MGTKNNPGSYDCYANAEDDEPMFTLLARDASAPDVVEAWATRRENLINIGVKPESDRLMVAEARQCAEEMRSWRETKKGEKKTALVAAGAKITCENGHVIGEVRASIDHSLPEWHRLVEWTANAPPFTTPATEARCMGCGGKFMTGDAFGWSMRFEDGSWRP